MFKDEVRKKLGLKGEMFPFTLNMLSRDKMVICGVKRIVSTTQDVLKVQLGLGSLCVSGKSIKIVEIGGGDLFLEGEIVKIEFEN